MAAPGYSRKSRPPTGKVDHHDEDGAGGHAGLAGDDDTEDADEDKLIMQMKTMMMMKPVGREGYPLQRAALRRASLCLGGRMVGNDDNCPLDDADDDDN